MLTALVLQLIQCVIVLPEHMARKKEPVKGSAAAKGGNKEAAAKENGENEDPIRDPEIGMDRDVLVNQRLVSSHPFSHRVRIRICSDLGLYLPESQIFPPDPNIFELKICVFQ